MSLSQGPGKPLTLPWGVPFSRGSWGRCSTAALQSVTPWAAHQELSCTCRPARGAAQVQRVAAFPGGVKGQGCPAGELLPCDFAELPEHCCPNRSQEFWKLTYVPLLLEERISFTSPSADQMLTLILGQWQQLNSTWNQLVVEAELWWFPAQLEIRINSSWRPVLN